MAGSGAGPEDLNHIFFNSRLGANKNWAAMVAYLLRRSVIHGWQAFPTCQRRHAGTSMCMGAMPGGAKEGALQWVSQENREEVVGITMMHPVSQDICV